MPANQEEDITMEEIKGSLPEFMAMTYQIIVTYMLTMETGQQLANIAPLQVIINNQVSNDKHC